MFLEILLLLKGFNNYFYFFGCIWLVEMNNEGLGDGCIWILVVIIIDDKVKIRLEECFF